MAFEHLGAPLTPGLYGARLLVREFFGGLNEVRQDILAEAPAAFQQDLDHFQVAGRYAEVGSPFAEMANPGLPRRGTPNETEADGEDAPEVEPQHTIREARLRSAHIMAFSRAAIETAVSFRDKDQAELFLQNTHDSLIGGTTGHAERTLDDRQAAVYGYGTVLHKRLGLHAQTGWGDAVAEIFADMNARVVEQVAESAAEHPDHQRLFAIAMNAGAACTEMAAVVAAAPEDIKGFGRFRIAARNLGALGFIEEQATHPQHEDFETFVSALLRKERGEPFIAQLKAYRMRKSAEGQLIRNGLAALNPGRERNMLRTQIWFAQKVYWAQRRATNLKQASAYIKRKLTEDPED